MIVIYPFDNSTNFLNSIVIEDIIKSHIKDIHRNFSEENFVESLELVAEADSTNTIVYLGHGSSEELQMNINLSLNLDYAASIFSNKKLLLISCYSADFLNALNNKFEAGIGFGNIIDSKVDLGPADYVQYNHEDFKCIYEFRAKFVALLKNSLIEGYSNNYSFLELYNSLRIRINKIISQCSLSNDKTMRLTGLLMFDLKKNMVLKGNWNALLIG
jgi:hypothetical protein